MKKNFNDTTPLHIINSIAPTRICDNGGWTDTWFAEHGKVFNIAVYPCAEVQIEVYHKHNIENQVVIQAENYNQTYKRHLHTAWQHHPILEAAIDHMKIPSDKAVKITVFSKSPPGAGTGTSAAVLVALIGALDRLTPGQLSSHEIAYIAQTIETKKLGQQCGIQDQLAAAYGGINYIDMFQYPYACVSPIQLPKHIKQELEQRLILIYLGKSHQSSQVHEKVIKHLEEAGSTAPQLKALRATAAPSKNALYAANFKALGQVMIENTAAQQSLHPALISPEAKRIIKIAQKYNALGWKVNGAGGDGGSVSILCEAQTYTKRLIIKKIEAENPLFKHIPIQLSQLGLQTWKTNL